MKRHKPITLDEAVIKIEDRLGHIITFRRVGDAAICQYGILEVSHGDDCIDRVAIGFFLGCPRDIPVFIGQALADHVVLTKSFSIYVTDRSNAIDSPLLIGPQADVTYGRDLILRHRTHAEAIALFQE